MKTIFFLGLALIPLAGFSQAENFTINGKVNKKYNGRFVKLYYSNGETKLADSAVVTKGAFSLKGSVDEPTVGKLSMGTEESGDRADVFLSDGIIRVEAKDSIHYAAITGTALAESHELLAKKLKPADDKIYNGLNTFRNMPEGEEKKAYLTKVMSGFDSYSTFKRETIHQFAKENPASYVSLYYLDKNAPGNLLNYETTYPYYSLLSPELKATPLGKQMEARLLAVKGTLTGENYKDFSSTTPDGKTLVLKDVIAKNKYTLIDFWASWCGPCRKENPNVVKAYEAFKDQGFTVLSVSLDDNADKWKAAIEKDGMPWYHVSSLKGWKEPAAVLYNIRSIPQNVLVDGNGKVLATNLRAETLYNKVQELVK